jgi:hypothetical protein
MKYNNILRSLHSVNNGNFIKNRNIPACKNCKFFIPNTDFYDFTSDYSKCNKFGVKNIVCGKIKYENLNLCRNDEFMCGIEGKYFEKEPNLYSKILLHKLCTTQFKILYFFGFYISVFIIFHKQ